MEIGVLDLLLEDDSDGDFEFFDDLLESDKFFGDFFDFSFLLVDLIKFADIDGGLMGMVSLLGMVFRPLVVDLNCAIEWVFVKFLIGKILGIIITGCRLKIEAR